jgi:hypothetical protein
MKREKQRMSKLDTLFIMITVPLRDQSLITSERVVLGMVEELDIAISKSSSILGRLENKSLSVL